MATVNSSNKRSAKEIFLEALDQPTPGDRAAYLDATCGHDPLLRQRVDALLADHFEQDSFMQNPAVEVATVQATVPTTEGPSSRIGRYKLLQIIGEGGMGVVYMAEQEEPVRRRVALKIIKLGMDTRRVVARFEAERQALALMDHPNIARVLDGGATDTGRPYFVMELVQGVPITEFCDKNQMPAVERLKLFIPVCQAVQSAHQKGIIHRDLKPSNILVTLNCGVPAPKVIDFGVAKATNQKLTEKTLFTNYGSMVGTPAYMSPEQAEMTSLDVDTRTDIYSLGVLLYELLTGTTPFPEKRLRSVSYSEMQRIILEEKPERPSTRLSTMQAEQRSVVAKNRGTNDSILTQAFASDLDWIVMKCLEKDRARRYGTAEDVARDLQRHLNHEPVLARPPSRLYEFQKTVRRHKLGFAATAAVIAALAAGVLVSTWEATQARRAEREQSRLRDRAEQNLYTADMERAAAAWKEGQVTDARGLLDHHRPVPGSPDRRGFEWRYLWEATAEREVEQTLKGLPAPGPWDDGQLLISGTTLYDQSGDQLRAWDMTDWNPVALAAPQLASSISWRWSPSTSDGFALDSTNGMLILYHLPGFEKSAAIHLPGPASVIEMSTDCRLLAVAYQERGSYRVLLWDVTRDSQRNVVSRFEHEITTLKFSPGSRTLAVASVDGEIGVFDLVTLQPLSVPLKNRRAPDQLIFSPEGRRLFFSCHTFDDQGIRVWDWTAQSVLALAHKEVGTIFTFAFSPDGSVLASSWRGEAIVLWDTRTLAEIGTLRGHRSLITRLAFSPDSKLLASASRDRTARLWDLSSQRDVATLGGFPDKVCDVVFSRAGSNVIVLGGDGTVKVWKLEALLDRGVFARHPRMITALALSPDERHIASIDAQGTLVLWDRASRRQISTVPLAKDGVYKLAFAPSGDWLAWVSGEMLGTLSMASGESNVMKIEGNLNLRHAVAFSPDSREVAFSARTRVILFDLTTQRMQPFAVPPDEATALAYSRDGSRLVVGDQQGNLTLWDRGSGKKLFQTNAHPPLVWEAVLSPDGAALATCGSDSTIKLWAVLTNSLVCTAVLRGHVGYISSVSFSPDGTRLVSIGGDHTLKLWDVARGMEVGTLEGHHALAMAAAFSKNGNSIYSAGQDGEIRIWNAPPFEPTNEFWKIGAISAPNPH